MSIEINWADEWREAQRARRAADDVEFWDGRAPDFAKQQATSKYAARFILRAEIREGETVFDMGCGAGTLALPLARAGHHVYACDFSPRMLELMMQAATAEGIAELIHPLQLSWDDSWAAYELPSCDLAFASRSIATMDLQASLEKLDGVAKRRACITLSTGVSPRDDETLLRAMGRPRLRYPDYIFGMNILWEMGKLPHLDYIHSARTNEFSSFGEAIEKTCTLARATDAERARLETYAQEHLHQVTGENGDLVWSFDHQRVTSWAFISWDKGELPLD